MIINTNITEWFTIDYSVYIQTLMQFLNDSGQKMMEMSDIWMC